MSLSFPIDVPLPAVHITPTTSNARIRLQDAVGTWQVDGRRELVTIGDGITRFKTFRQEHPSSVQEWREVWALPDKLLTPLLSSHFPQQIPVEWPDPFPLAGQLCPARDWPYYSYLVIYDDRRAALTDLARWHDGVAQVLTLCQTGSPRVRKAAVTVLEGDRAALQELTAALRSIPDAGRC